ncbi:MAG TPA: tRNA lysidine(34) synthetase TilS [Actinomycetota bacterium]|nr:tRNA lysidine(34) synthetase TilS [Actinomycetota bacterium]
MRRPPAVARVLERVTRTAREHEMFASGDHVVVSVSGGPDSVCLLYSLWHLRRLFAIRLEVFHFDHRLRKDSAKDADYVRRLAERLNLPFHLRTAEHGPRRGQSVDAWATVARGNAANELRTTIGAQRIAEGHTLDDQAETVLLNLIRGAGLEGVSGIWPGGREGGRIYVQPLFDVERAEVEAFCRAMHLRPRRDPTNRDPRHLRNAIRLKVVPAMERATGREVRRPIARSADLLRESRLELSSTAVETMRRIVTEVGDEQRFDAAALRSLPKPIASRVVRLALYQVMTLEDVAPWSKEAVEAVLDLAAGRPGRRRDLPNGLKARRERGYVSVSRTSPESRV